MRGHVEFKRVVISSTDPLAGAQCLHGVSLGVCRQLQSLVYSPVAKKSSDSIVLTYQLARLSETVNEKGQ